MKNIIKIICCSFIISAFLIGGCTGKNQEKPANMEEIHREQGVPVRLQEVVTQEFVKEIDFTVTVAGLRETPVSGKLNDQIQRIRVKLGDIVTQNQIIMDFPQDNPQANYSQARAAFDLAEQTWQRMQNLYEAGAISRQDLDGAETQFKVAEANWDAVQQSVHVRAPISGVITDINVREMEKVDSGHYLFTVAQLNKMHGRIWISEDIINSVPKNADVIFTWNNIQKPARISNLALSLNRDHNAFAADIEIDNQDYVIRSGVTGNALIVLYKNEKAIVVPRNVVQRDADGNPYVYVANGNIANRKSIVIANESELNYEVKEGLELGDKLIVQGVLLLSENSKISY